MCQFTALLAQFSETLMYMPNMQKFREHTQPSENCLQFLVNESAVGLHAKKEEKKRQIGKPDIAEKLRKKKEVKTSLCHGNAVNCISDQAERVVKGQHGLL